tara:strand:+ start:368 stop:517 length:150 start_codon:yes stop_codon:yes gene_type:complete
MGKSDQQYLGWGGNNIASWFDIVPVGDNFEIKSGPRNSDINIKTHTPTI